MHLKLRIYYDGTSFVGSQAQAEGAGRTVQGELEGALSRLAGEPVRVAFAGRTDTGVHAWGQVVSFSFPDKPRLSTPQTLVNALNHLLPTDLIVRGAEEVAEEFHARFSARKRAYRYLVWNAGQPIPFLSRWSLHVRRPLDLEGMREGLAHLIGAHDFASFAGRGMGVPGEEGEQPSTTRTVYVSRLIELDPQASFWDWSAPQAGDEQLEGRLLAIDLVANAFLPHMIRTIVGTMLEVGQGRRSPDDIEKLIRSRDRRLAGMTAKPHGLCLMWVEY